MHLKEKQNNSSISMCCQYPWQQWFLKLTISEDRVGPATKKKFCCITSQRKKGSFLFSSLFLPPFLTSSPTPRPPLLLLLSLSLSKSNVTITGNRKKIVLVFLNQEPKFQVTGSGRWEAEKGLGFYVPVQKSNIANAFQTQKLEPGLRCTLIYTFNKCWVPKWLGVRETQHWLIIASALRVIIGREKKTAVLLTKLKYTAENLAQY